ncbi:MAG: hypothetical protein AAFS07_18770, partial [Pseudomonadota bacterium]
MLPLPPELAAVVHGFVDFFSLLTVLACCRRLLPGKLGSLYQIRNRVRRGELHPRYAPPLVWALCDCPFVQQHLLGLAQEPRTHRALCTWAPVQLLFDRVDLNAGENLAAVLRARRTDLARILAPGSYCRLLTCLSHAFLDGTWRDAVFLIGDVVRLGLIITFESLGVKVMCRRGAHAPFSRWPFFDARHGIAIARRGDLETMEWLYAQSVPVFHHSAFVHPVLEHGDGPTILAFLTRVRDVAGRLSDVQLLGIVLRRRWSVQHQDQWHRGWSAQDQQHGTTQLATDEVIQALELLFSMGLRPT